MRRPESEHDTEVFSGPTAADALAAARAAYGPAVQVLRAARHTGGISGLLGRSRVQVTVRRPPATTVTVTGPAQPSSVGPAPGGADAVDTALDELLGAAERRERAALAGVLAPAGPAPGSALPAEETAWTWEQQQDVERLLAELTARGGGPAHPAPAVAEHDRAAQDAPGGALSVLDDDGPRDGVPPTWDRGALRRLGVPSAVLSRLPVEDPDDEQGWRSALTAAVAAVVPPPGAPDALHPVVVSGYGLRGAVEIVRAACEDGARPGTLAHDGVGRPATAAVLVEVIASCVRW